MSPAEARRGLMINGSAVADADRNRDVASASETVRFIGEPSVIPVNGRLMVRPHRGSVSTTMRAKRSA